MKKQVKKAIFGHFLENFDKNRAFRKIVGSVTKDLLKSTKVGPFGSAGGRIPESTPANRDAEPLGNETRRDY